MISYVSLTEMEHIAVVFCKTLLFTTLDLRLPNANKMLTYTVITHLKECVLSYDAKYLATNVIECPSISLYFVCMVHLRCRGCHHRGDRRSD